IADPLVVSAGPAKAFVPGSTVLLEGSATGGGKPYTYQWNPIPDPSQPAGANGANVPQPVARPSGDTIFTLTVTDRFGTVKSASVNVVQGFSVSLANQPANGGSISRSPVKALYIPGEIITFTANPGSGFGFVRWEIGPVGGPVSQFNEQSIPFAMPAGNLSVTAVYTSNPAQRPSDPSGD